MQNHLSCCCVILLIASVGATAQGRSDVAATGNGSIAGRVLCADTQKPARFAEVRLVAMREARLGGVATVVGLGSRLGEGRHRTNTIADGSFFLDNLPPGDYLVSAWAPGYIDAGRLQTSRLMGTPSDPASVKLSGMSTSVHIVAGQTATAMVTIYRGAVLAGSVTYDDGTPALGVAVSALMADGSTQTVGYSMSNDRGDFRVAGLPAGSYLLQARPLGSNWIPSLPVYYGDTLLKTAAKRIELKAGDEHDGLDLQLPVTNLRQVSGVVQSAKDGHGIGHAIVSMTLTSEAENSMNTVSLPDGSFRFQNVPDGKFTVRVDGARDLTAGHGVDGERPDSSPVYGTAQQNIEVHGGDVDHVVFSLPAIATSAR